MLRFNKKEPLKIQGWTLLPCKFDDGEGYFILFPHPTRTDKMRKTSPVYKCIGNIAITESGSQYILNMPALDYVNWLNSRGFQFSSLKPIPDELLWKSNATNNE